MRRDFPWKLLGIAALGGFVWAMFYYMAWHRTGWSPVYDILFLVIVFAASAIFFLIIPARRRRQTILKSRPSEPKGPQTQA